MTTDAPDTYRVGELARRGGVTVRTVHHYEKIGLLRPGARSAAGHRLYGESDLERLTSITTLRRVGLRTRDIGAVLDSDQATARRVLEQARAEVERTLDEATDRRAVIASALELTDERDLVGLLASALGSTATLRGNRSIVVYRDLVGAYEFLADAFDLTPAGLTYDESGAAVHAEMLAGDAVVWLHPERESFHLFSAATLGGSTGSMAVMVHDVDEHHRHAVEAGATIVSEPIDQPYGYREYSAVDSEGGLWSFMKALAQD